MATNPHLNLIDSTNLGNYKNSEIKPSNAMNTSSDDTEKNSNFEGLATLTDLPDLNQSQELNIKSSISASMSGAFNVNESLPWGIDNSIQNISILSNFVHDSELTKEDMQDTLSTSSFATPSYHEIRISSDNSMNSSADNSMNISNDNSMSLSSNNEMSISSNDSMSLSSTNSMNLTSENSTNSISNKLKPLISKDPMLMETHDSMDSSSNKSSMHAAQESATLKASQKLLKIPLKKPVITTQFNTQNLFTQEKLQHKANSTISIDNNIIRLQELCEKITDKNDPKELFELGKMLWFRNDYVQYKEASIKYITLSASLGYFQAQIYLAMHFMRHNNKEAAYPYLNTLIKNGLSEKVVKAACQSREQPQSPDDIKAVYEIFKYVANMGCAHAQYQLGTMIEYQRYGYIPKDTKKAIELYESAAQKGNDLAQYTLGRICFLGCYGTLDINKGMDLLKKSASQNNVNANLFLGNIYQQSKDNNDLKSAFEHYTVASNLGNPVATFKLTYFYEDGIVVDKNPNKFVALLDKAAKLGDPHAQVDMGDAYECGWYNFPINLKKAFEYYKQASKKFEPHAQYRMGMFYKYKYSDIGIAKDINNAFGFFESSARQEHADAMVELGIMFETGEVRYRNKDYKIAMDYYQKAAAKNNPMGLYCMGMMYFNGLGVPIDIKRAHQLIKEAAGLQCENAQNFLKNYFFKIIKKDPNTGLDYIFELILDKEIHQYIENKIIDPGFITFKNDCTLMYKNNSLDKIKDIQDIFLLLQRIMIMSKNPRLNIVFIQHAEYQRLFEKIQDKTQEDAVNHLSDFIDFLQNTIFKSNYFGLGITHFDKNLISGSFIPFIKHLRIDLVYKPESVKEDSEKIKSLIAMLPLQKNLKSLEICFQKGDGFLKLKNNSLSLDVPEGAKLARIFSYDALAHLGKAIADSPVEVLKMSHMDLGLLPADELIEFMKYLEKSKVTSLDWSNNSLGGLEGDFIKVAEIFPKTPIRILNLAANKLEDILINSANSNNETQHEDVDSRGLKSFKEKTILFKLAEAFNKIEQLDISNNAFAMSIYQPHTKTKIKPIEQFVYFAEALMSKESRLSFLRMAGVFPLTIQARIKVRSKQKSKEVTAYYKDNKNYSLFKEDFLGFVTSVSQGASMQTLCLGNNMLRDSLLQKDLENFSSIVSSSKIQSICLSGNFTKEDNKRVEACNKIFKTSKSLKEVILDCPVHNLTLDPARSSANENTNGNFQRDKLFQDMERFFNYTLSNSNSNSNNTGGSSSVNNSPQKLNNFKPLLHCYDMTTSQAKMQEQSETKMQIESETKLQMEVNTKQQMDTITQMQIETQANGVVKIHLKTNEAMEEVKQEKESKLIIENEKSLLSQSQSQSQSQILKLAGEKRKNPEKDSQTNNDGDTSVSQAKKIKTKR